VGVVSLNVNFALREPVLGVAAVPISGFMKFGEYCIGIAIITME